MKSSIIYFIVISFLFQSCYTYRAIDLQGTPLVVGKNYKIRQGTLFTKSKLLVVNDSTLTVKQGKVSENISISKIKEIKESKFSTLKTIGLVLGIGLVAVGIVGVVEMNDFGFDLSTPMKY